MKTTVPTFGDTPARMALRFDNGGESLFIWGDVLFAPAYLFGRPKWGFALDTDEEAAAATKVKGRVLVAKNESMIARMLLLLSEIGYVERPKQGYGFVTAP